MKYRLYVDEVGNPDLKSSDHEDLRYLCLTGVIFELKYVDDVLFPEIEKIKKDFFGSHLLMIQLYSTEKNCSIKNLPFRF